MNIHRRTAFAVARRASTPCTSAVAVYRLRCVVSSCHVFRPVLLRPQTIKNLWTVRPTGFNSLFWAYARGFSAKFRTAIILLLLLQLLQQLLLLSQRVLLLNLLLLQLLRKLLHMLNRKVNHKLLLPFL